MLLAIQDRSSCFSACFLPTAQIETRTMRASLLWPVAAAGLAAAVRERMAAFANDLIPRFWMDPAIPLLGRQEDCSYDTHHYCEYLFLRFSLLLGLICGIVSLLLRPTQPPCFGALPARFMHFIVHPLSLQRSLIKPLPCSTHLRGAVSLTHDVSTRRRHWTW